MKAAPLINSILGLALAAVLAAPMHAQIPITGRPVPGMAMFDTIMTGFMSSNSITAGVLAISRNGRVEYARGFGWLTPTVALPENAMLRTASAVKPITAAAVRQLAADGALGANG